MREEERKIEEDSKTAEAKFKSDAHEKEEEMELITASLTQTVKKLDQVQLETKDLSSRLIDQRTKEAANIMVLSQARDRVATAINSVVTEQDEVAKLLRALEEMKAGQTCKENEHSARVEKTKAVSSNVNYQVDNYRSEKLRLKK